MLKQLVLSILAVVVMTSTVFSFVRYEHYISTYNKSLSIEDIRSIKKYISYYSRFYEFDPILVLAIMKTESTFKIDAYNSLDARGLMQIRVPIWFKHLKSIGFMDDWRDFYDPLKNIRAGMYILDRYRTYCNERNKGLKCTLQKYNGDPNGSRYFNKVINNIRRYYDLQEELYYITNLKQGAKGFRLIVSRLDGASRGELASSKAQFN